MRETENLQTVFELFYCWIQEKSAADISRFLFLNEGTVRNYEKRYKEGGLEKLVNDYYIGRSAYLSPENKAS